MKFKETPFGKIPEHWKISNISQISLVVTDYVANGSFASLAENVKYHEKENYAVLIRLVDYKNNFQGGFVYIDEHAYEFLKKSKLYGGEIIISNVGANVGTVFLCPYLDTHMSLAPNAIMVKFNDCDDFYYYWLKSPSGQYMLQSIVTGSAQPKFNKTNFRDMVVPVPPIYEQRKIASILKQIDAKIENNININQNLEQQVSAIYQAWFEDFIPFGGKCPSNWKYAKLCDIAKITSGKRPPMKSSAKIDDAVIPIVGAASVMGFTTDANYTNKILIMGRVGTLGVIQRFNIPCWASDNTLVISSTYYEYIYQILRHIDYSSINRGSTQPLITQGDMNNTVVLLPDNSTILEFENIAGTLMFQHDKNINENELLAELRDTLLPKLMSGELDISTINF